MCDTFIGDNPILEYHPKSMIFDRLDIEQMYFPSCIKIIRSMNFHHFQTVFRRNEKIELNTDYIYHQVNAHTEDVFILFLLLN